MAAIQTLISEAVRRYGVQLHGIEPREIPDEGIGIVATASLKPNDLLLRIPTRAFRTLDTTPRPIIARLPRSATVHCILALSMALDTSDFFAAWRACMPGPHDFAAMPIRWGPDLTSRLPGAARKVLGLQTAKFDRDWAQAHQAFPQVSHDDFLHCWLLVNTRSFHHATPATRNRPSQDKMVLQPVADLFNHGHAGACRVSFDDAGFCVRAARQYAPGDEVTFCYGRHSNETLWVEYGFLSVDNPWDDVLLDDAIMPRLSAGHKGLLAEHNLLGTYYLDPNGPCHRTQAALRILLLPLDEWKRFAEGVDDGDESQAASDRLLRSILGDYLKQIDVLLSELAARNLEETHHQMNQRWLQIKAMLLSTTNNMGLLTCTGSTDQSR